MDAEHRHDLKENDLAKFIADFGQWWNRHGLKTMIVALVVLAVVAGWQLRRASRMQALERTWGELATTGNPRILEELAGEYSDPAARALANLWGAARYNMKATLPAGSDEQAPDSDTLDRAERMLEAVLAEPEAHELIKLNAMLVHAAVKENRRDFAAAAAIYEKVQQGTDRDGYRAFGERAAQRLQLLEEIRVPVVFAPEPQVPQVPEVPTTSPGDGEATALPAELQIAPAQNAVPPAP